VRLPPGAPLEITLAFAPDARIEVGRLAWAQQSAVLEWSAEIVKRRLAVDGGLRYPPESGLHAVRGRDFEGLHGFLADSLPDGWGYLVMRKRLAKLGVDIASLNPLERLALVGESGRGALVYKPATTPGDDVEGIDLDILAEESAQILNGEEGKLGHVLAKLAGGSGGARPKVHVGFSPNGDISVGAGELPAGHAAWIVKFKAMEDPKDIGPIEEAYALMAEAAGLKVSEHRLIPSAKGPGYFATRRFDRPTSTTRHHMLSLAGAIEAPAHLPSSYDTFLRATRAITRNAEDVSLAFRRMVFNVLAHNRDDHTKQHAFLMDSNGDWRLAPAFDLTFAAGPSGEHFLEIEGEGRRPTRGHVDALGKKHGLNAKEIARVIDDVRMAIAGWERHASKSAVSKPSTIEVRRAQMRVQESF
jgi:serine/threonine-protein kinase HipA